MHRTRALIAGASLALLASASSLAADLTVTTHTATPAGFAVNSHLIQGERDAILVDAQFTLGEAAKAVEMVQRSGKRLKYVVVTHGHPTTSSAWKCSGVRSWRPPPPPRRKSRRAPP